MATYVEYSIDQGASFSADVELMDSFSADLVITDYKCYAQMRQSYTYGDLVNITVSLADADAGVIRLSMTPAQTKKLKAKTRHVFDVFIVSPTGEVTRVIEGQIDVNVSVTDFWAHVYGITVEDAVIPDVNGDYILNYTTAQFELSTTYAIRDIGSGRFALVDLSDDSVLYRQATTGNSLPFGAWELVTAAAPVPTFTRI